MKYYSQLLKKAVLLIFLLGVSFHAVHSQIVAHFPMEVKDGRISETESGASYEVVSSFPPEVILGAEGKALRFDGYSTYVVAGLQTEKLNKRALTFTVWCSMETYPMMNNDAAVNTSTILAGNLDEDQKSGFAFLLSSQGDYSFDFYLSGWRVSCKADEKLVKYSWNQLAAVVDVEAKEVRLYRNAEITGSMVLNITGDMNVGESRFMIGKSFKEEKTGPFYLNTVNGAIDDIRIYASALTVAELGYKTPENDANLSIPETRFENDIHRPVYHGMPVAAWTNEPHGLIHYEGKYHLFFQKNANGPYWGRLHWGHIVSENLYDWHEEKIALAPSVDYDWKGCWSGCLFSDATLTSGKPQLFYTAVDNAKAAIAQAFPMDDALLEWKKDEQNPIITGKPAGLSDDFRDPYIFTHNGKYYMIVGTGKDGIGAATLHRYDQNSGMWSNDGSIFFKGQNSVAAGTFWEMPVIVPMNDNKWLFLVTPLGTRQGVKTLYWVGNMNDNGTFTPLPAFLNEPKEVELGGVGKEGYGLLSPSLCALKDGKYVVIGIVPDKLSSRDNYSLGWAHTFSLPRELSLDENNSLIQKPYAALDGMRTEELHTEADFSLDGTKELAAIGGRCLEAQVCFKVNVSSKAGFRFFKGINGSVNVYYDGLLNQIVVDARSVERLKNDNGVFDGLYTAKLPESLPQGSALKLHAYVDHSIMDIFVNDKWAFSIRLFPTDEDATGVELFSEAGVTNFERVGVWKLDPKSGIVSGMGNATVDRNMIRLIAQGRYLKYENVPVNSLLSFYDFSGRLLNSCKMIETNGIISSPVKGNCIVCIEGNGLKHCEKVLFNY